MKALVYHGPMDVRIDDKPKPTLQNQEDIILKVTKTALCGSDLHLYLWDCKRNGTRSNSRARIYGNCGRSW
jgi:threonine dehydrogenase-like Zn-dependent dehydrogenase